MATTIVKRSTITDADAQWHRINNALKILCAIEEQADLALDTSATTHDVDPHNALTGFLLSIKALAKHGYAVAESAMGAPRG